MNHLEEVFDMLISSINEGECLETLLSLAEKPVPISIQLEKAINSGASVEVSGNVLHVNFK